MKQNKIAFIIASLLLIILPVSAMAATLSVTPEQQALDNQDITCKYGSLSGNPILVNWYWYKNGNSVAAYGPIPGVADGTNSKTTLTAEKTAVGDKWACEARSFYNVAYEKLATPVTIVAAPQPNQTQPQTTTPQLIVPDYSIPETQDAVCKYGEVAMFPELLNWYWYKNQNSVAIYSSKGTADGKYSVGTLPSSYYQPGDQVYCEVRSYQNVVLKKTETPITIEGTPTAGHAQITPYSPTTSDSLTCSLQIISGIDPSTYTLLKFYWYKNGNSVATYGPLAGANINGKPANVLPTKITRDETWTCKVYNYKNFYIDQASTIVLNAKPTITAPTLTPSTAYTDTDLTCNAGTTSDADGNSVTVSYRWMKNGQILSGQTTKKLTSNNFVKGDVVLCQTTPTDDREAGITQTSNPITIANSAPTCSNVQATTKENIAKTITLSCTDKDANEGIDTLTFKAVTNPAHGTVSAVTGNNITYTPSAGFYGLDSFTFTANDGTADGNAATAGIGVEIVPSITAEFTWQPLNPTSGQTIQFTDTSILHGVVAVTYKWDFGDGTISTQKDPTYTYSTPGDKQVTLTVSGAGLTSTITKIITVTTQLEITNITCFNKTIVGKTQSCTVTLNNGQRIGGADIQMFFSDDTQFGSCTTNELTGKCEITRTMTANGTFTVYATATKTGYLPDTDKQPTFTFQVWNERYKIIELETFKNNGYVLANDTFYRGEPVYLSFKVVSMDDLTHVIVNTDLITEVQLISPAGGRIQLSEDRPMSNGRYYYVLTQIPLTHDFIGESKAYTFVFNFTDNTGGEENATITILNNPPQIVGTIPTIEASYKGITTFNLTPYESDKEDSGADLRWSILGVDDTLYTANIDSADLLTITPKGIIGTDIVTLVLKDLDNDNATQNVNIVLKNMPPKADFTWTPITPNVSQEVQFTDNSTDPENDALTYSWNFGDSATSTEKDPKHTYTTAGTYTITLTVNDGTLTNTITKTIVVSLSGNLAPIANAGPDQSVTINTTVTLDGTASSDPENNPLTYSWTQTSGATMTLSSTTSATPTFTATTIGIYTFQLIVNDGAQNSAPDTVTITVTPTPNDAPVANFTWTPTEPEATQTVTFTDLSTDPNGDVLVYLWNFGDSSATEATQNPTHAYAIAGNYTITLAVSDGQLSNTMTKIITVKPKTIPSANLTAEFTWGPARPIEGQIVGFVDMSVYTGTGNLTYSWNLGNGQTSNVKNPTTIYTKYGIYNITLTVTDGTVTSTKTKQVVVDQKPCEEEIEDSWLKIEHILSTGGEIIQAGDQMKITAVIKNVDGDQNFKDVSVIAAIYDLDARDKVIVEKLSKGSSTSRTLTLDIPEDAQPGEYWLRLYMDTDTGVKRIVHRQITIE